MLGKRNANDSLAAINHAWELGIRAFDTAASYGYGAGEAWLGSVLAGRAKQAWIITKYGVPPASGLRANLVRVMRHGSSGVRFWRWRKNLNYNDALSAHWSAAAIQKAAENALLNFRTDRLGAFLLHAPPAEVALRDDAVDAMRKIRASGIAEYVGVSGSADSLGRFPSDLIVQFGFNVSDNRMPVESSGVRLVNHVMGGATGAAKINERLLAAANLVDTSLFARLSADPSLRQEALLRCTLVLSGAMAPVLSMFAPAHQRANVEALLRPRLSSLEVSSLVQNLITVIKHG